MCLVYKSLVKNKGKTQLKENQLVFNECQVIFLVPFDYKTKK